MKNKNNINMLDVTGCQKFIPKKIHYCWFGNAEPTELMKKCILSWKEKLPDYEIIEWNNENIKDIKSSFLEETIKHKKWAFASDYVRLWALYNFGGIYFDTDVEVLKSFDELLDNNFFIGIEKCTKKPSIACGIIGSIAKNQILKDLLNRYDSTSFIKSNGRCDLTPNPKRFTQYFKEKFNFVPKNSQVITKIEKNITLYPTDYFYPKNNLTKHSFTIHHYADSWSEDWYVKTWINTPKFALHIFKREVKDNFNLPLLENEELIACLKITSKKYIAIVNKQVSNIYENYNEQKPKFSIFIIADNDFNKFRINFNVIISQYFQNYELLIVDISSSCLVKNLVEQIPMTKIKYFKSENRNKNEILNFLKEKALGEKHIFIENLLPDDRTFLERKING